jgi:hypothetical protein
MPRTCARAVRTGAAGALVAIAVVVPSHLRAAGEKTLSGRWSASAMKVTWAVGAWGDACGPRPSGGGAPAGTVTIEQIGSELRITGAGRTYTTAECWEQGPGLARRSHSAGKRGWSNKCATSASDPRQATVITTISATDDSISFDETGQYQFVLENQNCTASVRRSRWFKLIQREGETPAPTPAATATATATTTATALPPATTPATPRRAEPPQPQCKDPGPPARLEVRPSRKLMRPGEEFQFRALVLDERGCQLPAAPSWSLPEKTAPLALVGPGKVKVAADAKETEVSLSVAVAGKTVSVQVEIASKERYEALLAQGGFDEAGESAEAAVAVIAGGSLGGRDAVAEDRAARRKLVFVGIAAGTATLLGAIGLWMFRRSRERARLAEKRAAERAASSSRPASPAAAPSAGPPRAVGTLVCPTCRGELPPNAQFCPRDGNRLVPLDPGAAVRMPAGGVCPTCGQGYDPGVERCKVHDELLVPPPVFARVQPAPAITKKICPLCGTQYPGDSSFCGGDGAALVPVN